MCMYKWYEQMNLFNKFVYLQKDYRQRFINLTIFVEFCYLRFETQFINKQIENIIGFDWFFLFFLTERLLLLSTHYG